MTRVIQRCSTCGLEHDDPVGECEACLGALRYWCRAHSGEIGWLDGAACRRCAEDKARLVARPRPAPAPAPTSARPRPAPVAHPPRMPARAAPPRVVAPVSVPATPTPERDPRASARFDEWVDACAREALILLLSIVLLCAAAVGAYAAAGSESVDEGLMAGGTFGLILGIVVVGVRLATMTGSGGWLDRPPE